MNSRKDKFWKKTIKTLVQIPIKNVILQSKRTAKQVIKNQKRFDSIIYSPRLRQFEKTSTLKINL